MVLPPEQPDCSDMVILAIEPAAGRLYKRRQLSSRPQVDYKNRSGSCFFLVRHHVFPWLIPRADEPDRRCFRSIGCATSLSEIGSLVGSRESRMSLLKFPRTPRRSLFGSCWQSSWICSDRKGR